MNAWVVFDEENVYALATTSFVWEPIAMTKNLVLFSLSGLQTTPLALWTDAKSHLATYAAQQGCKNIIAYSNVPGVIVLAQREGADTQTHLLTWRL